MQITPVIGSPFLTIFVAAPVPPTTFPVTVNRSWYVGHLPRVACLANLMVTTVVPLPFFQLIVIFFRSNQSVDVPPALRLAGAHDEMVVFPAPGRPLPGL